MPKSLMIRPEEVRRPHFIEFEPIPANQYKRTMKDDMERFAQDDLVRIHHDMAVIRAFENMLQEVKTTKKFHDIEYDHRGPAHLSIGQEASAVGQAYLLGVDDHIFGSHRSHGDILAKGLSAIEKLDDSALMTIMESYWDGAILKIIEKDGDGSVKDLAVDFLLYGHWRRFWARGGVQ